jgi:hypothetical protein
MKIKSTLGLAVISGLTLATAAIAAPPGGSGSHGNAAFGHNQRTDLQTGPGNADYGRNTANRARLRTDDLDDEDNDNIVKPKKTKKAKHTWTSYPGNSYFGRNQRINHFKGSGNNAHGKTTSANAKSKPKKND